MQCGFAMVECGFTRAKNAGNIIMKNLMDFCIGAVVFIFLGYGLLVNPHVAGGFIGTPTLGMFGAGFDGFDWSSFVFQLVFCATCATIVSGAMAEQDQVLRLLHLLRHHQPLHLPHRGRLGLGRRRVAGQPGLY